MSTEERKRMPQYWRQVRGGRDGVPVSWFPCKCSSCKFANWPNSAGKPGVYKTQSNHTKNKSRYRTGMKGHKKSMPTPSYLMQVRGKRDGKPVSWLRDKSRYVKFANWPNSAGMGPGVHKTKSIHTKAKSPYPTGAKGHKESKPIPSYWIQVKGKKDRVPVSWFPDKSSVGKFANWPNSAGMGPRVYKTQSNHTKNKSPYPTGTISLRNVGLCLNIKANQGKERWSTGKMVFA
jgi:hypothetical protein